jgi:hypothetical protein
MTKVFIDNYKQDFDKANMKAFQINFPVYIFIKIGAKATNYSAFLQIIV